MRLVLDLVFIGHSVCEMGVFGTIFQFSGGTHGDTAAAAADGHLFQPDENRNVWYELVALDEKKRSIAEVTEKGELWTKVAHPSRNDNIPRVSLSPYTVQIN